MIGRAVIRSSVEARIPASALPPAFLLPIRARFFNSTAQIVESPAAADGFESSQIPSPTSKVTAAAPSLIQPKTPTSPSLAARSQTPLVLSDSIKQLLPLLKAQPSHFITAHIHAKPYLVTAGDTVRLPFHMPGVVPGDVLRLNRATSLGSRDYTLKGAPYLDERVFECRARVMGVEAEPLRIKEKTKRRNRKVKTVKSKHKFTMLRIAELKVKDLDEIQG